MSDVTSTSEQYPVIFTGIEKTDNVEEVTPVVLKQEYLAGGFLGNADTLSILAHNQDVWSGKLTDVVIAQMLKDPEIYKCVTVIKNGVLGDGVTFTPAVNQPTAIAKPLDGETEPPERKQERLARDAQIEKFKLAKKYSDFAARAFNNLEVPLRDVLNDMLDALPYGNRVAEKVFEEKMDKEFNTKLLYFKHLNVKPRESTIFVVDKFKNLVGLKAIKKVKDEKGNETLKEVVIKKEKFAIFTYGSENNDPRGKSFLEAVHQSWHLKMQLWPEYLRWLIYSAVPPIVGYTSGEVDSKKVLRDAQGELVTDAQGNPVFESDVGALLIALKQVRNASAIALPFGAKVDTLNSSVSGDPFKGFRDVLNEEIEMGLILQTLATSDSRHNTRAASQTHITILDDLIWKVKQMVVDMLTGVVRHLMEINFPNFDESLTPIVSMGDTARRDFAGDVGAISQLSISGYIGESQKVGIDNILGLPPRDVVADREFLREQALEKIRLDTQAAKQLADAQNTSTSVQQQQQQEQVAQQKKQSTNAPKVVNSNSGDNKQ